jgi:hypothetical protein
MEMTDAAPTAWPIGLAWVLAIVFGLFPQVAQAQDRTANEVLSFLLTTQSLTTADFVKDQQAAEATRDTLVRALVVELANVPLTTSSGGFSYRFNPSLGTMQRATQGFGPFFVDRATTAGSGQASLSAAYRYSQFSTLDNRNLRDGSLVTTSNKFNDESAAFDVETLTLNIETSTITLFGNYGLTDWLDIAVALPIVELSLSGEGVNTYRGVPLSQTRGRADSVGIADIPIRSKVHLPQMSDWDLAVNFELRLPTGDPDTLRGSGRYAYGAAMIGSIGEGAVESHVNAGVSMGGASNQITVAAAVATTVQDRVTVSAEMLVRHIGRLHGIRAVAEPHPLVRGVQTTRLLPTGESATTVAAVAGLRWNISGSWLFNSYVFLPITRSGLVARPIPAFSVDYSFEP